MGFYGTLLAPGGTVQVPAGMRTPSQGRTGNRVGLSNGLSFRGRGVEVRPPQYSAQLFRPIAHDSSFQPNAIILPGSDHQPLQNQLANPFEIPLGPAETLAHHLILQAQAQVIHLPSVSSPEHPESVFSFPIGYISDNQSPQDRLATAQIQTLLWGYVLKQLPNHTSAPNPYQNMLSENWILIQQFAGDLIEVISSQNPESRNLYFLTLQSELADWNHIVGDGTLREKVNFAKDQAYHAVHSPQDRSGFLLGTNQKNNSRQGNGFGSSLFTPRPNSPKGEHDEPIGDVVPKQETPQDTPDPIDAPGANKSKTEIGDQPQNPDHQIGDDVPDLNSGDKISADSHIQDEINKLKEDKLRTIIQQSEIDQNIDELEADITFSQRQLTYRRHDLSKTEDELAKIKPEADRAEELKNEIEALERRISQLKTNLNTATRNRWPLGQQINNLERELIGLQRNYTKIPNPEELISRRDELIAKRNKLEKTIEKLTGDIKANEDRIAELQKQYEEVGQRLEALNQREKELQVRLTQQASQDAATDEGENGALPKTTFGFTGDAIYKEDASPSEHRLPPIGQHDILPPPPIDFDGLTILSDIIDEEYESSHINNADMMRIGDLILEIYEKLEQRAVEEELHRVNNNDRTKAGRKLRDATSLREKLEEEQRIHDDPSGQAMQGDPVDWSIESQRLRTAVDAARTYEENYRKSVEDAEADIRLNREEILRIDDVIRELLARLEKLLPDIVEIPPPPPPPPLTPQQYATADLLRQLDLERRYLYNLERKRNNIEDQLLRGRDHSEVSDWMESAKKTNSSIKSSKERIEDMIAELKKREQAIPRDTHLHPDPLSTERDSSKGDLVRLEKRREQLKEGRDIINGELNQVDARILDIDRQIEQIQKSGRSIRPDTTAAEEINNLSKQKTELQKEKRELQKRQKSNFEGAAYNNREQDRARNRIKWIDEILDLRNPPE